MVCIKGPLIPSASSYSSVVRDHKIYHDEAFVQHCKKYEIHEREKYYLDPPKRNDILVGEKRLREFENLVLNAYNETPHKFQRGFLQEVQCDYSIINRIGHQRSSRAHSWCRRLADDRTIHHKAERMEGHVKDDSCQGSEAFRKECCREPNSDIIRAYYAREYTEHFQYRETCE